jgi:hypothetical protein
MNWLQFGWSKSTRDFLEIFGAKETYMQYLRKEAEGIREWRQAYGRELTRPS